MSAQRDILSPSSDNKDAGAATKINASMKFLQDHLMSKKRAHQVSKTQLNQRAIQSEIKKKSENDWDPEDEYDPLMPNSYEVLQAEYLKAKELRLASLKAASSSSCKSSGKLVNIPNLMDMVDKLDHDEFISPSAKKVKGTAIAPPPSLLNAASTSSSQSQTKNEVSEKVLPAKTVSSSPSSSSSDGGSVAAKIMSKMGYKLGQGLGKDEQGISSPLEVEKSGLNAGRIVCPKSQQQQQPSQQDKRQQDDDKMAKLLRESTRVLLLQNMVGPGEVDEDLEAETKEECKKYGEVVKCLIFEIPNKRVPDDEAVRIFVEFKQVESSIKAASDLNGRYFGGRIVRASFYSVDKLNRYELGPA